MNPTQSIRSSCGEDLPFVSRSDKWFLDLDKLEHDKDQLLNSFKNEQKQSYSGNYQTRNEDGSLGYYKSFIEAFLSSVKDTSVWKISFQSDSGKFIRLLKKENGWMMDNMDDYIVKALKAKGIDYE